MRHSRITLVVLLSTLLGSACYSPSYEGKGGFTCATNGQCPEGFTCSPQKVCVKPGAVQPDLGGDTSRVEAGADAGTDAVSDRGVADRGPDLPAKPTVACRLEGGSVKTIEANNVTGHFGFALDESAQMLYASFVTKTTGARTLYVRNHKVGSTSGWGADVLKLPLKGSTATDPAATAIAAVDGKWTVVYQDTLNSNQELRTVNASGTPTSLASDNFAGAAPDVVMGKGMQGFIAVHQTRANVLAPPKGEILVVDDLNNVAARYTVKGNAQHPATGITNRLAFSPSLPPPPNLLYAGVVANSLLKEPSAVLVFSVPLKVPIQLNPVETIIGSSSLPPAGAGADIVAGDHLVFGRQEGNGSQVFYRAPGKTSVEPVMPGGKVLEKVSLPRVAARDGLVGVVMKDSSLKLHVSVRDDRNGSWSADLLLPDIAAQASIAATRGSANEVIFHVAYRATVSGTRLLHQPVICTKQ